MGRKQRRKQTPRENVELFCKRGNIICDNKTKDKIEECFGLFSNSFSSKHKLNQYVKCFILYDLRYWKQRLRRLSSMNLKSVTKKKFLLLYGKNETLDRWNNYVKMQSKTNTYEYKKEKYGWTEDDFLKYNKSRSVTLDNMIKKYGEIEGKIKYETYVDKQRHSGCSLDYFIEKYGEIDGTIRYQNLCLSKSLTLENFIKKYGEELGKKKYRDLYDSKKLFYSKSSQELFWKIKTKNCYFAEYNKEFGVLTDTQYYYYDYVDTELKKCIEYNGDYWHCNPKFYGPDYKTHYGYSAVEIWNKDEKKLMSIKNRGYDVMVIWESEYLENPEDTLKKIEDFLYDKN